MRWSDRILPLGVAVIGALVAALGLAGCGRKGGLDAAARAAVAQAAGSAAPEPGRSAPDAAAGMLTPPPRNADRRSAVQPRLALID